MADSTVPRRPPVSRAPARDGRVTLRVLAERLNLSPASVSLVLNDAPGAAAIPRATQDRIRALAERLHYRPNSIARSLRHKRSRTIGVMVPEISEGYAALVMSGIEDRLLQEGFLYFVASHRHREDLLEEYPKLLMARAVDGLIAIDTPWKHPMAVPVVSVSGHHHVPGITNIVLNHDRAATVALEHLHALGHRRLAFIKGQSFSSDTATRWNAIRRAARTFGLTIDARLVAQLEGDNPAPELGYHVTHRLLATGARFSALFAFNDISAIGAIRALREHGLTVPGDVSVVGFDDIQSAAFQNPALTTVKQPLKRMGELAAETILKRLEADAGAKAPRLISVEPELIVRGTTGPTRPAR